VTIGGGDKPIYEFAAFRLNPPERLLLRDGQCVSLTPKAFDLLVYLVEHHGRLVEKQTLLSALWPDAVVEEANLAYNVSALRKVLDEGAGPSAIQTVPTKGYRFVAPVTTIVPPAAAPPAKGRSRRWATAAITVLLLLLGAAVLWLVRGSLRSTPARVSEEHGSAPSLTLTRLIEVPAELRMESAAISPDGKYLAYSDLAGIHVQVIDSGETHRISDTRGASVFGWTPDGSRIRVFDATQAGWDITVIGSAWQRSGLSWPDGGVSAAPDGSAALTINDDRELRLTPLRGAGRSLVRLGDEEDVKAVSWTPDAKRVFFIRTNGARLETAAVQDGASSVTYEASPGRMIRFLGPVLADGRTVMLMGSPTRQDDLDVFEIRVDARTGKMLGGPRWLTQWKEGVRCWNITTSADGSRVGLMTRTDHFHVHVGGFDEATARIDRPRHLTLTEGDEVPSAWLPDNRTVIFQATEKGSRDDQRGIFRQEINSKDAERLLTMPGYSDLVRLAPDGRWLLFIQYPDFYSWANAINSHIMRAPVDGGRAEEIASSTAWAVPQCSLVPKCILFDRHGEEVTLYDLDLVKGKGRALATLPRTSSAYISPDGTEFSYLVEGSDPLNRIRTISFVGKAPREIVVRNAEYLNNVDWLPDGSGWLSVNHVGNGPNELMYITRDGQARVVWAPTDVGVIGAIPSRDSKHLALQTMTSTTSVWMLTASAKANAGR